MHRGWVCQARSRLQAVPSRNKSRERDWLCCRLVACVEPDSSISLRNSQDLPRQHHELADDEARLLCGRGNGRELAAGRAAEASVIDSRGEVRGAQGGSAGGGQCCA